MTPIQLQPIGFNGRTVRAVDHGAIFAATLEDGLIAPCSLHKDTANNAISLSAGWLVVAGRLILNSITRYITLESASGFIQLVVHVDTSADDGQGSVEIQQRQNSSLSGFAPLQQQSINSDDPNATIYEVELCVVQMPGIQWVRWLDDASPKCDPKIYVTNAVPTSSSPDGVYLVTGS